MVILIPYKRTNIDGDVAKLLLVKYINSYDKRAQQCHQNKAKIYSMVLRKFIEAMNNCLEGALC